MIVLTVFIAIQWTFIAGSVEENVQQNDNREKLRPPSDALSKPLFKTKNGNVSSVLSEKYTNGKFTPYNVSSSVKIYLLTCQIQIRN